METTAKFTITMSEPRVWFWVDDSLRARRESLTMAEELD